jgi:hypothetical protein
MKITELKISGDARRQLEAAKDDLQAAFAARDKAKARVEEVEQKRSQVTEAIESQRAALDPLDEAQCRKLTERKEQLALLDGELKKSGAVIAGKNGEILMAARRGASNLRLVLLPIFNARVEEAIGLFSPYYENRAATLSAVRQSSWGTCFVNQLGLLLRVESVLESENILSQLDQTLAGSIAFVFWRGAE